MEKHSAESTFDDLQKWFSANPPYFIKKDFLGVVIFKHSKLNLYIAAYADDFIKRIWDEKGKDFLIFTTMMPNENWKNSKAIGFASNLNEAENILGL